MLIGVTVVSLAPIAMLPGSAWKPLTLLLGLITLAYFVIADFLFVARLAAYVEILRDEPEPEPVVAIVAPPPPQFEPESPTTHDPGPTTEPQASS